MNAKFNLPDFYIGDSIYNELIALFKKYPEIIIPNTEISCIYGNFPSSIWNGGGFTFGNVFSNLTSTAPKLRKFIHTHWSVPNNCFSVLNNMFKTFSCVRSNIHTLEILCKEATTKTFALSVC